MHAWEFNNDDLMYVQIRGNLADEYPTKCFSFMTRFYDFGRYDVFCNLKKMVSFQQNCFDKPKYFTPHVLLYQNNPLRVPSKTAAKLAKEYGAEISIDLNYTSKIWTDDINPINVVSEFLQLDPLLKISEDDVGRFLRTSIEHEEIMKYFQLEFGINRIYLTLDSQGVKYVDDIRKIKHLPAQPIKDVKDATGAGDASWSGFLYGFTNGFSQEQCLKMGLKLASIKLQHVGGWPEDLKFFWE